MVTRRTVFAVMAIVATAAGPAQAQSPQALCDNVRKIVEAAFAPAPFSTVLTNGAPALLPEASFRECSYDASGPSYSCRLPVAQAQMATLHNNLGQVLTVCLETQPSVEQVEPGLGRLPYIGYLIGGGQGPSVGVTLYPRQDWGMYQDDAWDEEFTDFGFDLVVTRLL